ncbi:TonB-dependent receptor [Brevundimonas sp. S30B]|uniref:TonB-dependent receptor n=1 Tax=unclassified Brevundimonas TaxID=2622653 RepID=UPI001071AC7F|nr:MULTISPECIES: TonB-dependent receptor [unclassified Brevundimonas]QBX38446.1 TonB-dependent receptor [Brevundimonas sp. MF30-B]TFW02155.1 TonB-dependent receptor [Brevundimonas sp. S30B]
MTAPRPRGSVISDVAPERTFSPIDVRAFGASTVEELLEGLGPQVSSSRGRQDSGPVTLLNGRRVSNFLEVARIPTEAIERVEIFPEELALSYGYRAEQKVVNIVTFERFRSTVGQVASGLPTQGARETGSASASQFAIRGDTRFSFGADYSGARRLLESDRDVRQLSDAAGAGQFRTLLPQTERMALNGLVSGVLLDGVSSTISGRFETVESGSRLGEGPAGAIARDSDTRTVQLGTTQSGQRGRWLWNFTGNYNRVSSSTLTDVSDPLARRDEARSVGSLATADLLLAGPLLDLPAGPMSVSLRGGVSARDFSSTSRRSGVEQDTRLSRDTGGLQASLSIPIFSRRADGLDPGALSANVNIELEQLSDFGRLQTFGYGLNWAPVRALSLTASVTREEGAPTVEQLGGPLVVTPNVRTFDFTRREVVDVTRTFGGNRDLLADDRHVLSVGLSVKPLADTDLALSMDYVATRIDDPIVAFPIATPELEAAFPDRFTRDGEGRLLKIDARPVNFASSRQKQLRSGINFTRPLGATPPLPAGMQSLGARFYPSETEMRRRLAPGTQMTLVEPGSPMARRFETLTSRVFFSLYHTWQLEDEILLSPGGPRLDLLDGDAINARGGARRHELELQAGAFRRGLGARLTVNWQSDAEVRGAGGSAGDLAFSELTTVNLSLFANLADQFGGVNAPAWLKGARATLGITNLFDDRQRVRDAAGSTPISYQPAYLDPIGRVVSLGLRKVF